MPDRAAHCNVICVFEVSAERHAGRDSSDFYVGSALLVGAFESIGEVVGRGIAFGGGIRREDDFLDAVDLSALFELAHPK